MCADAASVEIKKDKIKREKNHHLAFPVCREVFPKESRDWAEQHLAKVS